MNVKQNSIKLRIVLIESVNNWTYLHFYRQKIKD